VKEKSSYLNRRGYGYGAGAVGRDVATTASGLVISKAIGNILKIKFILGKGYLSLIAKIVQYDI